VIGAASKTRFPTPASPVTRVSRSVSGACWTDGCSPCSAAFPLTLRIDCSILFEYFMYSAAVRSWLRTCGSCGLSLHPSAASRQQQASRGLPVLVMKFQTVWGLRLRETKDSRYRPAVLFHQLKRRRPDASFRSSIPSQPVPLLRFATHLTVRNAKLGPSGSLSFS